MYNEGIQRGNKKRKEGRKKDRMNEKEGERKREKKRAGKTIKIMRSRRIKSGNRERTRSGRDNEEEVSKRDRQVRRRRAIELNSQYNKILT